MRSLFFIRHKLSDQWFTGNHIEFSEDFNEALIYQRRSKAEKQIRFICENAVLRLEGKDFRERTSISAMEVVQFALVECTADGELL